MDKKSYHHFSIDELMKTFSTSKKGLSEKEVNKRQQKYGANILPKENKFSAFKVFIHQFKNPLIYILAAAVAISFVTGHVVDALIIVFVILVSAVVGFIQEYKANQALEHLHTLVKFKAKVIRDGLKQVIPQEQLVPGDIVELDAGDKIPADVRLFEAQNFHVIEASLTGESVPSKKELEVLPEDTALADRENMAYLGTVVAKGFARGVVVSTGANTEIGRVANLVKDTKDDTTPLQKQLTNFGKLIGIVLIGVNVLIFGLGILTGKDLFEMFLTSVAVVVSAVPEGLLPAMTVILAIGAQKLAKNKGLVRKMVASETLGSVTVICSDKTGTLTKGEMRVAEIITENNKIPEKKINSQSLEINEEASHMAALKAGLLCNDAVIENPDSRLTDWKIIGDPTDKALMLAARASGLKKEVMEKEEKRVAEVPFDSEYKFMATLHENTQGNSKCKYTQYVKGAPEKILELSSHYDMEGKKQRMTEEKKKEIKKQYEKLTSSGLRVIATAYKYETKDCEPEKMTPDSIGGLILLGLIALKDPLRPEAKETIALCQQAGIRPIIVTGDHRLTAMAIVQEAGLEVTKENVMEGRELDKLSDEQLKEKIDKITIFARVEPEHKIRLVTALQSKGEVVSMTGDGINDAPALKKADIGVAVGSGTDVAKEVADLVLLDDNFKTIVQAVRRGRIVFNNIRKVVLYLITGAFTEMVLVGGAVILGFPLPILPVQILWIKLIEDTTPAMSLSFDEIDEDVMKDPPRDKNEHIINRDYKKFIAFYAIIMDLTLFGLFYYFWQSSGNLDYARTLTFVGLGFASFFYIYSVRGLKKSILHINPFSNKLFVGATIFGLSLFFVAVYIPFFNRILHTVPLGLKDWLVLLCYGVLSIIVYEIAKKLTVARKAAK